MAAENHNDDKKQPALHHPSPAELRGWQSVRATFRLSEKAIAAMRIVSVHLGIKQKSLFDHLIDDVDSLNRIARDLTEAVLQAERRVPKTFVLSRRALNCLEKTAKNFDAPRDALVEHSIQRLLPVIERERRKHDQRKALLTELQVYHRRGEELLARASHTLGEEDPFRMELEAALLGLGEACERIASLIERGQIIEEF
jgi:hypothetical protein